MTLARNLKVYQKRERYKYTVHFIARKKEQFYESSRIDILYHFMYMAVLLCINMQISDCKIIEEDGLKA